ncbi:mycothiol synthase [Planosporangium flavigriseum]|uniref:Mycothiol acetyltransferase n=1 Tax=Planosporangium flavigriseum TaxID=373681 RepID=A0A8J3LIL3_9ACTN|nr:mycothiol synthase [Planosporangium flavigriseum]GIG72382.1 mycothiol acetyltransferase [Planosporangium flavigriseum]
MTAVVRVQRNDRLTADEVIEVLDLMRAAGDADGAYPLSEHVVLHLRHGGGDVRAVHLLARHDGRLVGYAHVDTTDPVEGASAELAVHPLHRRRGLGRALVTEAMAVADERAGGSAPGRLRLWAHGDHPSASALSLSLGFERWRVLWQMRRSLRTPISEPALPHGVSLRAFRPGSDDAAWVALNAAAFASHPEQGKWTIDDLHVRMKEPWFDPAGFLLAQRDSDGELLGFHWTKIHGAAPGAGEASEHAHEPIGEVYVLGVAPSAHGTGLGTALTLAGLHHLRSQGLDQAMLYVDESNTSAVALYRKLSFARWVTDVCFRRQV